MESQVLPLLALVSILLSVSTKRAEGAPLILNDPRSLNVSAKALAEFSCEVSNADIVLWYANGFNLDNWNDFTDTHYVTVINSTTSIYNISFVVHEQFQLLLNNTEITCVALTLEHPFSAKESKAAELKIQGVLDSPTNIHAYITTDAVSISWLPPYTLDGIQINYYEVNFTVENNSGIIEHNETEALDENITIPLIDQSACTVYHLSVQARSDAGLGNPGTIDTPGKYEAPRKLNASQIDAVVNFTEEGITLWFTFEQDNCVGQRADFVSATVQYSANFSSTNSMPSVVNDKGKISINVSIPKSAQGSEVMTIITLNNSIGSTDSEPKLTALASIEKVVFTNTKAMVIFQCYFTELSDTKECYIVLQCTKDSTLPLTFNLSAQENSYTSEAGNISCTVNTCTTYDVSAFDITNNGSIGVLAWSMMNLNLCSFPSSASFSYVWPSLSLLTPSLSPSLSPEPNNSNEVLLTAVLTTTLDVLLGVLCTVFLATFLVYLKQKRHKGYMQELANFGNEKKNEEIIYARLHKTVRTTDNAQINKTDLDQQ